MKYLIIGAVAGGASTAARLRRLDEQAEIIIFEKGGFISYANCGLPYYIGDVIEDRNKLFVQTAAAFHTRFNIDVRVNTQVTAIDPASKTIRATHLPEGREYAETYDKLVLAPGAEPVRPPLPGIDLPGIYTLRNVADTDTIKAKVSGAGTRKALVIGAGFIGLEMAENFRHLGLVVDLVEMASQVLVPVDFPIAAILQDHIRSKGVNLHLGVSVTAFEKNGDGLRVILSNGQHLESDIVILSIGVRPDTRLAMAAGLKTGPARAILVNEYLQTSEPDIYAVGDAIEFANPITGNSMVTYLAGPANKQGRIVADNIVLGNKRSYKGAINTAIVKVFDMTVGTTGMASKHLRAADIEHIISTTHNGSHASYYPDAKQMSTQIAFSPDGRLLGAQVIGFDGVDKRVDVYSSIIRQRGGIEDLVEFEHAYAPPFNSAKDPVNMAGFVAENILKDRLRVFYWDQLDEKRSRGVLVDVRLPDEFTAGHIDGAINIPVDELRHRLSELSPEAEIYIYCEAGLRGYLAQRILRQNGFDKVWNLSGGYVLWNACAREKI